MPNPLYHAITATFALCTALTSQLAVGNGDRALKYEDEQVSMRLVLRTPEQLSAFYQGRGFNAAAIESILDTCFITPIIHNKTLDVLWLELDNWRFSASGQELARIKRDYWAGQWRLASLPQAQQSTFGWTLMPEVRDLRLDESVGGSVVIPLQSRPVTMRANFHTGADKRGATKTIVFEAIQCPTDAP